MKNEHTANLTLSDTARLRSLKSDDIHDRRDPLEDTQRMTIAERGFRKLEAQLMANGNLGPNALFNQPSAAPSVGVLFDRANPVNPPRSTI